MRRGPKGEADRDDRLPRESTRRLSDLRVAPRGRQPAPRRPLRRAQASGQAPRQAAPSGRVRATPSGPRSIRAGARGGCGRSGVVLPEVFGLEVLEELAQLLGLLLFGGLVLLAGLAQKLLVDEDVGAAAQRDGERIRR